MKAAPAAEQVAYLDSRGGRALLDAHFFSPQYASERIDDLLYTRRHTVRTSDGFYIETRMSIPVCKTEPTLADVQKAYGEADLVLSGKERQLFEKDAPANDTYYYDHFAFLVRNKGGKARITQVTSQADNVAAVRPQQDGLTWSDVPMPEIHLRIFYGDRKEIARVAFWSESGARLVSGELPMDTFRRGGGEGEGREELKHLGNGNWQYRTTFADGQTERIATLQGHAYHGMLKAYYDDGKPRAEANYVKGLLEGTLKQWRRNGEPVEWQYHAGKRVREGGDAPR